jgi:hypothetical protein
MEKANIFKDRIGKCGKKKSYNSNSIKEKPLCRECYLTKPKPRDKKGRFRGD